jgi:hypothetical protein
VVIRCEQIVYQKSLGGAYPGAGGAYPHSSTYIPSVFVWCSHTENFILGALLSVCSLFVAHSLTGFNSKVKRRRWLVAHLNLHAVHCSREWLGAETFIFAMAVHRLVDSPGLTINNGPRIPLNIGTPAEPPLS